MALAASFFVTLPNVARVFGVEEIAESIEHGLHAVVGCLLWMQQSDSLEMLVSHREDTLRILRKLMGNTDALAFYGFDLLTDLFKTSMLFQVAFVISRIALTLEYVPLPSPFGNNLFQTNLVLDGAPVIYVIALWLLQKRSGWTPIDQSRSVLLHFLLYTSLLLSALVGASQACGSKFILNVSGSVVLTLVTYVARASAVPAAVAFAFLILSSPGASRYSSSSHLLSTGVKFALSITLWLPQYHSQLLHVISAACFCSLGVLHTLAWIVLLSANLLSLRMMALPLFTGIAMLVAAAKLAWPPGSGPSTTTTKGCPFSISCDSLITFLADSKYGRWHVGLSSCVFLCLCLHGALGIVRPPTSYVLPVLAYIVLNVLHPAKLHWLQKLGHFFRRHDGYEPVFIALRRDAERVTPNLTNVLLVCRTPTCVQSMDCSDVVLLRPLHRLLDTAHYYSVASSHIVGKVIFVRLLVQAAPNSQGTSGKLASPGHGLDPEVDVIGFIKSHSYQALSYRSVIAFAYESGVASFTSFLAVRRRQHVVPPRDLLVTWTKFPSATADRDRHKNLALFMSHVIRSSGGAKVLFVITSVPNEFILPSERVASFRTGPSRENSTSNLSTIDRINVQLPDPFQREPGMKKPDHKRLISAHSTYSLETDDKWEEMVRFGVAVDGHTTDDDKTSEDSSWLLSAAEAGCPVSQASVVRLLAETSNYFPIRDIILSSETEGVGMAQDCVRAKMDELFGADDKPFSVLVVPEVQRSRVLNYFKHDLYAKIGKLLTKEFVHDMRVRAKRDKLRSTSCAVLYSGEYNYDKVSAYYETVQELQRYPATEGGQSVESKIDDSATEVGDEPTDVYINFIVDA
jgi:hypothetical protein